MHDPAAEKLAHPAPAEPTTPEGRKLKEQGDAAIANMNEHFDRPSGLGRVVDDDKGQPSDGSMPGG